MKLILNDGTTHDVDADVLALIVKAGAGKAGDVNSWIKLQVIKTAQELRVLPADSDAAVESILFRFAMRITKRAQKLNSTTSRWAALKLKATQTWSMKRIEKVCDLTIQGKIWKEIDALVCGDDTHGGTSSQALARALGMSSEQARARVLEYADEQRLR